VIVIVNQRKVAGQAIGPVADYIAMMALAQPTALKTCDRIASVLDLFSSDCDTRPPGGLTAGDAGFLRGLYTADLGYARGMAESQILDTMRKAQGF
jgi:hypothetical protein